jgi:hypothetical protein
MPRLDTTKLVRPAPRIETRTFTDQMQPGMEWTLTVRVLRETPFQVDLESRAAEYITDYVTGRNGGPKAEVPKIIDVDGNARGVTLNVEVCKAIAIIENMQVPDDGDEPYNFLDLVKIAVTMRDAFLEAAAWSAGLLTEDAPNP